jgi:biopolymer transport protein ExbD
MAAQSNQDGEAISDINIVPLVDIILVVLIIFMVTAPALMKPSVPIQLPEAASGDATEPTLLQIAITADNRVLVNNQEADEDEAKRLALTEVERNPEVQAVVAADRDVPYGTVIRVLDWVKSSGVKKFAVTTDRAVGE